MDRILDDRMGELIEVIKQAGKARGKIDEAPILLANKAIRNTNRAIWFMGVVMLVFMGFVFLHFYGIEGVERIGKVVSHG